MGYSGCVFALPVRCQDERSNLINVPMFIPVMGVTARKRFADRVRAFNAFVLRLRGGGFASSHSSRS